MFHNNLLKSLDVQAASFVEANLESPHFGWLILTRGLEAFVCVYTLMIP